MVGGPFELVSSEGKKVSDRDFRNSYMLLYFGFTNCPDICPMEMEKMTEVMRELEKKKETKGLVQPIFITVDPKRDTPDVLHKYKQQFHERLIALTGPVEVIKEVAKAYRIYISIPEKETDYLVDHSICFYLMGTDGKILEYFGQRTEAQESIKKITEIILKDQAERKSAK